MSHVLNSTFDMGEMIDANSRWLGRELADRAHAALSAHEDRSYATAVQHASVCLEAVLKRMLSDWSLPPEARATLGQLIGAVRNSGLAPDAVCALLSEANLIRNRSLHDKTDGADSPLLSALTVGDSLHLLSVLAQVTGWYGQRLSQPAEPAGSDLAIFLSVGTPHRLDQQQFLHRLRREMQQLGVEFRSLASNTYSDSSPLDQIADLLLSCKAALIVGLDRSHGYAVFERERSDRQQVYSDHYTATAWNQLEGGMASALRLPIVVLRERRLHKEGIFEAKNHRHHILDFNLEEESKGLSRGLSGFLAGWVQSLRKSDGRDRPGGRA